MSTLSRASIDGLVPRDISGKVVLVTGAGGGIGQALVAAFEEAKARRVVAAHRDGRPSQTTATHAIQLDVTDSAAVERVARDMAENVDVLVNNAGVNAGRTFLEADPEYARREMEVNYFGTLNTIRAFAPAMKARRSGLIINMLTVLSYINLPTMGSYCASKSALLSLTQAVRAELAPYDVGVCGVFPSAVDTKMSANLSTPKLTPKEVADAVVSGISQGMEDIFLGTAMDLFTRLRAEPKTIERLMASRLAASR